MGELTRGGRSIRTIFGLLGYKENDFTGAIGFVLYRSPTFLKALLSDVGIDHLGEEWTIRLQEYGKDRGFTDVELESPGRVHLILEAKRSWEMPTERQLRRYAPRLQRSAAPVKLLVTLSECSQEFVDASSGLPQKIEDVPLEHRSWKDVLRLLRDARSATRGQERHYLAEIVRYLEEVIQMQRQESNMVYCVSLGGGMPEGWKISWIDIVEKKHRYFHPVGNGWPVEPPNYMAFRYRGRLQSIHHIEEYAVVTKPHDHFPESPENEEWPPHFLYTLGPAIRPAKEVKNGKVYPNGRLWSMLDLLLTSKTVREARDRTDVRRRMAG